VKIRSVFFTRDCWTDRQTDRQTTNKT